MFIKNIKYAVLISLFFCICKINYAEASVNEKIITNLKTENATVFLNGAEITKKASVKLGKGSAKIVFSKLTPSITPESIRVSSDSQIKISSVVHKINYLLSILDNEKIQSLQKEFENAKYTLSKLNAEAKVLTNEWELLMLNREINKNESAKVEDFQKAMEYFRTSMTRITQAQIENAKKTEEAKEKYNAISKELAKYSNIKEAVSEIYLEIYSENEIEADFTLSYYTSNARWEPMYDIRTSGETNNINLVLKANVYQNTGENWDDVSLTLSSGNPSVGSKEPRLSPWRLYPYEAIIKERMSMQNSMQSKMADVEYAYDAVEETIMPEAISSVNENMSSLEFVLNAKVSLENAENKILDVADYTLDADYKHYAVRKLEKDAFLLAVIKGWEKLSLLPGEVNIYLNNSFVGKTYLEPRMVSDNLEISLGRDKSVIVTRVKGNDYKEKTTFGSNIKDTRSFDITIRNLKKTPIKITVLDQIPVSTDKTIVVEANELSGGTLNKETGEISWTLELKPGESALKKFKYSVTYPKNQSVILE